jgi:hypothetical protein
MTDREPTLPPDGGDTCGHQPTCARCGSPWKWTTEDDGTPVCIGHECMYEEDACRIIEQLRNTLALARTLHDHAEARGAAQERDRIRKVFEERRNLLQADIDTRDDTDPAYQLLRARKHEIGTLWAIINRDAR